MTGQPSYSRFQLLPTPIAIPGKCATCGSVDRPVIDFGINIDFYGVFYLCVGCLTEAAQEIGMVTGLDFAEFKEKADQSLDERLASLGLVGVSYEWYTAFLGLIGSISAATYLPDVRNGALSDGQAGEEEQSISEVNGGDSPVTNGSDADASGQDGDADSERGPSSVPANPINEPFPGFTPL